MYTLIKATNFNTYYNSSGLNNLGFGTYYFSNFTAVYFSLAIIEDWPYNTWRYRSIKNSVMNIIKWHRLILHTRLLYLPLPSILWRSIGFDFRYIIYTCCSNQNAITVTTPCFHTEDDMRYGNVDYSVVHLYMGPQQTFKKDDNWKSTENSIQFIKSIWIRWSTMYNNEFWQLFCIASWFYCQ